MKSRKIISIILLILMLLNIIQSPVQAMNIPMKETYIEDLGECERHLQYWKESAGVWSYIITTMVGYRIEGNLHYAYCMQRERKGVGGEQEGYNVNISQMLQTSEVWRAIINGFPYKTANELGVENDQDAFVATKQAIYSVMYNWDVGTRYRGADERGWQIVEAIKSIVNNARNGTDTPNKTNILKIEKVGEFKKESAEYYSQEFKVNNTVEMTDYIITDIQNLPEGSYSTDINNIPKIKFSNKENFKIFIPKNKNKEIKGYTFKYGHIINPKTNEILDEVLVSYFIKPNSYTTENMCEINSHGGNIVMENILEVCLENGAELAEPGEFTKRAFLNGRIDLSQAESIIDIINSKTQKESKASLKQLEGFLSQKITNIRKKIMDIMVDVEADIDYPEYDIEEVTEKKAEDMLKDVKNDLLELKNTFDNGKIIKDGIKIAIVGKPNAGKSSLLNALLREDRAIVSQYKGTTRDSIEELMNIDGIPIKIIDTAGIREADDEVEKIGIQRAKEIANDADLLIAIFDISDKIDNEDLDIIDLIKDKKAIIVLNKIDLVQDNVKIDERITRLGKDIIKISALNKEGIDQINKTISKIFKINEINIDNEVIVTNTRHKNLINKAIKSTENAQISLKNKMPMDIVAIDIKDILESLGEITGEDVSENIINEIFSKFCLGK